MRFVAFVMLLLSLGSAGCQSLFGRRPADARTSIGGKSPKFPSSSENIAAVTPEKSEPMGGLLAGYVVDEYNNRPENAYIRWVCVDESEDRQAPIDVAVSPQGYFTIRGLKPEQNYKLIARSKSGDKMIAGITYTRTPNIHVMIRMSEDLATAQIPDIPGSPALADARPETQPARAEEQAGAFEQPPEPQPPEPQPPVPAAPSIPEPTPPAAAVFPNWEPAAAHANPAANLQIDTPPQSRMEAVHSPPPTPLTGAELPPATPTSGESPGWVPGIAKKPLNWPPVMNVAPPVTNVAPPAQDIAPVTIRIERPVGIEPEERELTPIVPSTAIPRMPPPRAEQRQSQTPVPSCVLLGRKLVNLALYDLNNQPWEFRTSKRGKLILLDFWGTTCQPCIESMPYLRRLHADFGNSGLEVVGIAYDHSPSVQGQIQRIRQLSQKLHLSYLQLLGAGAECPVRQQFGVTGIPTIVLLDENGWILWRHMGMLDAYRHQELELLIRQNLDNLRLH